MATGLRAFAPDIAAVVQILAAARARRLAAIEIRTVASIFEVIVADESALDVTPRESWKAYMRAVVPALKANESTPSEGGSERKTGLYVPNVETVRLVRDERGWLRLAG